jgi:outer membrane immunogenic protein
LSHPFRALVLSTCIAAATLTLPHTTALAGVAAIVPVPAPVGTNSANASGWVGGGHAGYNWQQGAAVFGFETDLQATRLHSLMNDNLVSNPPGPLPAGSSAQTSAAIDWYGTFRGRLGVASGPFLFYGTGGLAYGNVSLSSHFTALGLSTDLMTSDVKTGWVAGAGFEYLWRPDLSFSLLYQYVDLGRLSGSSATSFSNVFGSAALSQVATTHAQFQTVMAGLSWHFAPMPSSGPWAGGYAGGHLGGAWGNSASAGYNSSGTTALFTLSDIRLKRDVALVGRTNDGLGIYSYKYLWSDAVYVGVMAQEVALIHPEAVVRDALTGYMAVDYGRLDLPAMRP